MPISSQACRRRLLSASPGASFPIGHRLGGDATTVTARAPRSRLPSEVSGDRHTSPRTLHAYIDEARRRLDDGNHLYLMVAVTVPGQLRVGLERDLRSLVPKGSHRRHFRRDRQVLVRQHLELVAKAAGSGLTGLAAHATIATARHEGRARVRCLAALVGHLSVEGVDELVIESRQRSPDVEDDRTLLRARQDGLIPQDLL